MIDKLHASNLDNFMEKQPLQQKLQITMKLTNKEASLKSINKWMSSNSRNSIFKEIKTSQIMNPSL